MRGGIRIQLDTRGRLGSYAPALVARAEGSLRCAAKAAGLGGGHELSVILCDNDWMRRVNRRWREMDQSTDVLAFPLHELPPDQVPPPGAIGDLVVSLPYLRRAARELGVDPESHLDLLLVHGLLHLLGHDHDRPRRQAIMRRRELDLLERIDS